MTKKGQYSVFSARTTPEGLAILKELRARLGLNWDRLVIPAVNAHYGVAVPMPILTGPTPEERAKAKADREAERAGRAEARAEASSEKKAAATKMKVKAAEKAKALKAKAAVKTEADKAKAEAKKAEAPKATKPASVRFVPAAGAKETPRETADRLAPVA